MNLRLFLFVLLGLFSKDLLAQGVLTSRTKSFETHVYQLTEEEARDIHLSKRLISDTNLYHTLVTTFPTDQPYQPQLDPGYYFFAHADGNNLKYKVEMIPTCRVELLNNEADLKIQVYDMEGNLVPDAEVKIGSRKLKYDEESESYRKTYANLEGSLEVKYAGMTHFYEVGKSQNRKWLSRFQGGKVFLIPLKLIWIPVRWAILLPVDVVLSVARLRPMGSVYTLYKPFGDVVKSIRYSPTGWVSWVQRKIFPNTVNPSRIFTAFTKPIYRPNDTLRMRLYAENSRGKQLKRAVTATLYNGQKSFFWNLVPESPGVYLLEFPLADSLKLKLDQDYTISLSGKRKQLTTARFRYEDYELKHAVYKMDIDRKEHFPDVPVTITASATDENDLPLSDVKLFLKFSVENVRNFHQDSMFIPFSFWEHDLDLDARKETKFIIPDSILPPISLKYKVTATLKNSNNQVLEKVFFVDYYQKKEEIKWNLEAGRLGMEYRINDAPKTAEAFLEGYDIRGNRIQGAWINLPNSVELNPWVAKYIVNIGDFKTVKAIQAHESGLNPVARRDRDSIYIDVINQHALPFSYHIYRLNDEIAAGYGDQLRFREKARNERNHSLSLQYLWGGRIIETNYAMELQEKALTVNIEQPQVIVPGQKVNMKVKVVDVDGDPVQGASVLSYGLTSKFKGYTPPSVPYTIQNRKDRSVYNHFNLQGLGGRRDNVRFLKYDYWNPRFGLDSIPHYQFSYPTSEGYYQKIPIEKAQTEFAPFITNNGAVQPVSYIFANGVPVYFSWSTPLVPYSFPIPPRSKQTIVIRTTKHKITLSDQRFEEGVKTIFSFDVGKLLDSAKFYPNLKIEELGDTFTSYEQNNLASYTAAYRSSPRFDMPFFVQRKNIFKMNTNGSTVFGPVFKENILFEVPDSMLMDFRHEAGYEYDFGGDIPKMRCKDFSYNIRPANTRRQSFRDRPLTREQLSKEYQAELNRRRRTWLQSKLGRTSAYGTGELRIRLDNGKGQTPLNTLIIFEDDTDFLTMYSGGNYNFRGLKSGYYTLLYLLPNDKLFKIDSLRVLENGINYYRIDLPDSLDQNEFSENTTAYLEEFIRQSYPGRYILRDNSEEYPKKIKEMYIKSYGAPGDSKIMGRVLDEYGEPLPFATIRIKDTNTGTIADENGEFQIFVKNGLVTLQVNFLGMETVQRTVSAPSNIEITVRDASVELSEVVVTSRRIAAMDQASAVSMSSIKVRGVSTVNAIKIKGGRDVQAVNSDGSPLYFVDGVKFTGDLTDLPKTVVTRKTLSPEEAQNLLGGIGANGAIMLTTPEGLRKQKLKEAYEDEYLEALANASSLRTNFKDNAFWQPALITDKNGEANFTATYPDDITAWRTFAMATRKRGYSGQFEGKIRSFKPIMGKLRLPRFLLPGDSAYVIGKGLNYTPDTLNVKTSFSQDGNDLADQQHKFLLGIVDTNLVIGPKSDTTAITYMLETEDGYADGEQRKIPVFPVGVEETVGVFTPLGPDTSFTLKFDPDYGKVTVRAETDLIKVVRGELRHVWDYKYLCNEQAASKLKAYLLDKRLAKILGEPFQYEEDINTLIDRLQKAQLTSGGWGWWREERVIPWISRHIVEALVMAREAGYEVNSLQAPNITAVGVYHLESAPDTLSVEEKKKYPYRDKIIKEAWAMSGLGYLEILERLGGKLNYSKYVAKVEKWLGPNLSLQIRLIRLKQRLKLPYSMDLVSNSRKTTLFGNSYWGDGKDYRYHLHYNSISTTCLAYQVLKADSASPQLLISIAGYLLESRSGVYYRNTYESIQVLEVLMETLAGEDGKMDDPVLNFSGGISERVEDFPYTKEVDDMTMLKVDKEGDYPIYFTAYQKKWEPKPDRDGNNFKVRSSFKGKDSNNLTLTAGTKTTLLVEIVVEKDCEFIMVDIPIPAGCTYESKPQPRWSYGEVHREYFRNTCSIFCTKMSAGKYYYEIPLMPQYTGSYTLNPAKAELMYFPTFFGREEGKRVLVE